MAIPPFAPAPTPKELIDGSDTTLHDHDGISENTTHRGGDGSDHTDVASNTAASHTQNTDIRIQDDDADTKIQVEESADEDKIRMDVAGVEAFLLSDIGVQTLAKQSMALGYVTSAQTLTTDTWTLADLDTEDYDIQNEINLTTNKFTATEPGKYAAIAQFSFAGAQVLADKLFACAIVKNSSIYLGSCYLHSAVAGQGILNGCLDIVNLAANDTLELQIYHNSGANKDVGGGRGGTFLAVAKIA